jgi:hypothetical protein
LHHQLLPEQNNGIDTESNTGKTAGHEPKATLYYCGLSFEVVTTDPFLFGLKLCALAFMMRANLALELPTCFLPAFFPKCWSISNKTL